MSRNIWLLTGIVFVSTNTLSSVGQTLSTFTSDQEIAWISCARENCITQSFVVRPHEKLIGVQFLLCDGDESGDVGKQAQMALGFVNRWGQRKILQTISINAESISGESWISLEPEMSLYNDVYLVQVWSTDKEYNERLQGALCLNSDYVFGRAGLNWNGTTLLGSKQDFCVRINLDTVPEPPAVFGLRNGLFKNCIDWRPGGMARPLLACWHQQTVNGTPRFFREPQGYMIQNPESGVAIEAGKDAHGYWGQEVDVPDGRYILSAQIENPKGQAYIAAGSKMTLVSKVEKWQEVTLAFSGKGNMEVQLGVVGPGVAKFRRVSLRPIELTSSAIPFAGGSKLGAIVLPDKPTAAQEYAAYELQRYIGKITGLVPGLSGRDKTFEGMKVFIGRANRDQYLAKLVDLPEDSYMVDYDRQRITLAGNTDRGTLYAVYEFLKTQGCSWYLPGAMGEVVPKRDYLLLGNPGMIETPDYISRGPGIATHEYRLDGTLLDWNIEDYLDWFVRNRTNQLHLVEYGWSAYFAPHRGEGHYETKGHSFVRYMMDTNPEWWALVDGKRTKLHPSKRPNNVCVSNEKLQDWVATDIIQFFAARPEMRKFSLCPNDYTSWCECGPCRSLDADQGKGPFEKTESGFPIIPMTDRLINFANNMAERVKEVFPDRKIMTYSYGKSVLPPVREKVHPNVSITICWHGDPVNRPILSNEKTINRIEGWFAAGMQDFGLYDYGNYFNTDCPIFWYYHQTDYLQTFNRDWGCRSVHGERSNLMTTSPMWHNLAMLSYWDVDLDYRQAIARICRSFYGPASESMIDYHNFMMEQDLDTDIYEEDEGAKQSLNPDELRQVNKMTPELQLFNFVNFTFDNLARGKEMLEDAMKDARGDTSLEYRVDLARYGHAVLTVAVARTRKEGLTPKARKMAQEAFVLARELAAQYDLRTSRPGLLRNLGLPAPMRATEILQELPITWRFKKDPRKVGIAEKWFSKEPNADWSEISIEKAWTQQGHDYHGVAWYLVEFAVDKAKAMSALEGKDQALVIFFGAVDGTADVYLDGRKIGEQKASPYTMWDQPFTISLPEDFEYDQQHRLVVRVEKDVHAAGIWKPVSIALSK